MRNDGAALATRPGTVVNHPIGPTTPGPTPDNLPALYSPDGINRAEYLYRDRQRFRDGSGPSKFLVGHDPYAEIPPRPDGRAVCSFTLSTDDGIHEVQQGSVISVRDGMVVLEFLATEPVVVRPESEVVVGGVAKHPGAAGNIDIRCRAGITGFPKVTVENPFPGMGGADVAPDGALILRRPNRPRMDALFADPWADHMASQTMEANARMDEDPKALVRNNLGTLRSGLDHELFMSVRKWAEVTRVGVFVQSFVTNARRSALILKVESAGMGDVTIALGFTDGELKECRIDVPPPPRKLR